MKQISRIYRHRIFQLTIGAILVAVVSGCTTLGDTRQQIEPAELSNEAIVISARYLPRSERWERWGREPNPFIAPRLILTPTELVVFDVFLENLRDGYAIALDQISLEFGGESSALQYPSSLRIFWSTHEVEDQLTGYDERQFFEAIDRDMVTRGEQNGLRESALGLMVFRGRFPEEGIARIVVPTINLEDGSRERHSLRVLFRELSTERRRSQTDRYR